ncbi:MAG: TetR/AcrR family transcriptional regulator [Anaerolineae bacterium]
MSDTKTQITDVAERLVRSGGYNGFSFRDIAAEIGIKSASVHYHFPTKEALALAVAERYKQRFFAALGDPTPAGTSLEQRLNHYGQVFQDSFATSHSACLCGMLSNEIALLPDSVKEVLVVFVQENVMWLQQAIADSQGSSEAEAKKQAQLVYSALEGAMGVAALTQDSSWLETVSSRVSSLIVNAA